MRKKLFIVGTMFLLVFQSCSSNEDLSTGKDSNADLTQKVSLKNGKLSSEALSNYVSVQLSIQSEIKSILDNEKNANFSVIQSGINRINTVEELEILYKSAKVEHSKELISMYEKLRDNSKSFRDSNSDFYSKYNEGERRKMLTNEIDQQLGYNENGTLTGRRNCHSAFMTASNRCMRDYAIEIGGSVLVGVFTGGVGGVIAGGIATAHMVVCNSDAESDYQGCVRNGGGK